MLKTKKFHVDVLADNLRKLVKQVEADQNVGPYVLVYEGKQDGNFQFVREQKCAEPEKLTPLLSYREVLAWLYGHDWKLESFYAWDAEAELDGE